MSHHKAPEQLLLAEIQVLLAEKRTYLAVQRTGFGIIALPFTIILFLVATAGYHQIFSFVWLAVIILAALVSISASGLRLFYQARRKIRRIDHMIRSIERDDKRIAEIVI